LLLPLFGDGTRDLYEELGTLALLPTPTLALGFSCAAAPNSGMNFAASSFVDFRCIAAPSHRVPQRTNLQGVRIPRHRALEWLAVPAKTCHDAAGSAPF